MKCPNCGAENVEGRGSCDACGVMIYRTQFAPTQHAVVSRQILRNRALMTITALAIVTIIVLSVVLAYALFKPSSPEDVLAEWIDCMNGGNARGAADLTIYSKMDLTRYFEQVEFLESIIVNLGTDELALEFAQEITEEEMSGEYWFPGILNLISSLESDYGIQIEDYRGMYCSITAYNQGVTDVWVDSWPVFKVDSHWYLAYGLITPD